MVRKKKILTLDEIKEQVPEGRAIIGSMIHRWRIGKMVLVPVTGDPGTGKSWLCMRIAELIYKKLGYGELKIEHIVTKDVDLLKLLLTAERGTVIIIEEASVLFNARRATSGENVAFSMIVDTMRKKGLITLMNFPFSDSLDKHGRNMGSHAIEARSLHKDKGMVQCGVLKLQYNDKVKKLYRKHLKVKVGKKIEKVSKVWFGSPHNKKITEEYEEMKDAFLKELYERKLKESERRKAKKDRELNGLKKKDKSEANTEKELIRIEKHNRIIELSNLGEMTQKEIGKAVGMSRESVNKIVRKYKEDELLI